MLDVVVLLPAYNEEHAIDALLTRVATALRDRRYRIVVVDDGSNDATAARAEARVRDLPLSVVRRPRNGGLGAAMATGLHHIGSLAPSPAAIVTMDADNTHDPGLIGEMLARIEAGADVVVASRFVSGAETVGVPLARRVLSAGARYVFGLAIGARGVRDYTSGYRAYRADLIRRLAARFRPLIRARGFAVMTELLAKAAADGAMCVEVPMILRYDLKESSSKLRLGPTLVEYARVLLLARLDALRTRQTTHSPHTA